GALCRRLRVPAEKHVAGAAGRELARSGERRSTDVTGSGEARDCALSSGAAARRGGSRPDAPRAAPAETDGRRAQLQIGGGGTAGHDPYHLISPPAHLREASGALEIRGRRESPPRSLVGMTQTDT